MTKPEPVAPCAPAPLPSTTRTCTVLGTTFAATAATLWLLSSRGAAAPPITGAVSTLLLPAGRVPRTSAPPSSPPRSPSTRGPIAMTGHTQPGSGCGRVCAGGVPGVPWCGGRSPAAGHPAWAPVCPAWWPVWWPGWGAGGERYGYGGEPGRGAAYG